MQQPSLVVMAAGMGSRFGGLKQITPVDTQGHAIIDYSLYDAYRAGFRKVVFIIKHSIESDFMAAVGNRMAQYFDVHYVFQENDCLPEGFTPPEGRQKPWGTGHAVACCRDIIREPFAVINADDFYGDDAYRVIFDFLAADRGAGEWAMVGYSLRNTVTENGFVSRGICTVADGFLSGVTERTHIEKRGDHAAWTEDGTQYTDISGDTPVSMNFWGFQAGVPNLLWQQFPEFLRAKLESDPLKCEYFLPSVVSSALQSGRASVRVLDSSARWHGVTYREDLDSVRSAIAALREQGVYPESLW